MGLGGDTPVSELWAISRPTSTVNTAPTSNASKVTVPLRSYLEMPDVSSTESKLPPKRSFADFNEPSPSSLRSGSTKRPRIETEEAIQQQPKPLKRLRASFLDSIDQLPSSRGLKRYHPKSIDSFVTQWLESGSEPESYRERHCRSDTLLGHLDDDLIPKRLTKSAPTMEYRRDTDGFALPPTPTSYAPSDISGASTSSSRKKNLVEDPLYRNMNLAANNIYMRPLREQFPEHITGLVEYVGRDRDSPGPSLDEVREDAGLNELWMGSAEPGVEKYFQTNVFLNPEPSGGLKRIDRLPMSKHTVPDTRQNLKTSTPVPDMIYGYNRMGAFTEGQQTQLISMGTEMVANSQDLIYPFFVIEFKADGPSGAGSLWVATNQCLGGSASCVNVAERLKQQLRPYESDKVLHIDSAAFSVAMSGTEARLYISWKHDELKYYMANVSSFLLQDPEHYLKFRKYVRNIIDWGADKRLKGIRESLDELLKQGRKEAAKSRPPPSDDFTSSRSQKRRSSSSRGR